MERVKPVGATQPSSIVISGEIKPNEILSSLAIQAVAPRLLALVTLSSEINISSIQAEIFGNAQQQNASNSKSMVSYFYDKHSKQRIAGLTSVRELLPVLDICRSADVVCFVVSEEDQHVDELGTMILRAVEAQGVGDVKFAIQVTSELGRQRYIADPVRDLR